MFETREIISDSCSYTYTICVLHTEGKFCMPSLACKDYSNIPEKELFCYDNPEFLSKELIYTIEKDLSSGSHSYSEIPREDYIELYAMLCHAKALGWFNE